MGDERRYQVRRTDDQESAIWRGQITARVDRLATDVRELREDIESMRVDDVTALRHAIDQSRESTRNVMLFLLAPLIVAVLAGIILFALTGTPTGHG